MQTRNLVIEGFRNLNYWTGSFSEHKTLIFGNNGVGKTSILEALYMLGLGKSFRENNKKQLIGFDHKEYLLSCNTISENGSINIKYSYKNKSKIQLQEKKSQLTEVQKYYVPMFFSAEFIQNIITSMVLKRKFLDRMIFGIEPLYLPHLLRYNHCIQQKNHLLKNNCHIKELESWNRVLSEMIISINRFRQCIIKSLNEIIYNLFGETVTLSFFPSIPDEYYNSVEKIFNFLMHNSYKERNNKIALFGPHRDKVDFFNINKLSIISNSSGEKKLFMFFIYLSYFKYFFGLRHEYPILLIDDYDAALDDENKKKFINSIGNIQIIATSVNKCQNFDKIIYLHKEN